MKKGSVQNLRKAVSAGWAASEWDPLGNCTQRESRKLEPGGIQRHFSLVQEFSIPAHGKSAMRGRRPAWLSQDILAKLKHKPKRPGSGVKDAQPREYRRGMGKATAQLELSLARERRNKKKGFFRDTGQQRKMKETVPPQ